VSSRWPAVDTRYADQAWATQLADLGPERRVATLLAYIHVLTASCSGDRVRAASPVPSRDEGRPTVREADTLDCRAHPPAESLEGTAVLAELAPAAFPVAPLRSPTSFIIRG
jgi:hypothetical protein